MIDLSAYLAGLLVAWLACGLIAFGVTCAVLEIRYKLRRQQ